MISRVDVTSACRYLAWAGLFIAAIAGWFGPAFRDASKARLDSSTSAYLDREKARSLALEKFSDTLPGNTQQLKTASRNIALIHRELRDNEAAAAKLKSVHDAIEVPQDRYCSEYVENLLDQANLHDDSGNFTEARTCYESILAYDRKHFGEHDLKVARDLNNLGLHYLTLGQAFEHNPNRQNEFAEAFHYLQHSMQIYREHRTDNGNDGVVARHNLSICQRNFNVLIAELQEAKIDR
ncbi:MAG: tetratricopeptide repeat protein [Candidatus Obscuribacterales bacterium]|nr:tetratricopeptide repeat protein [Candidatus Obscuribacterales bacterium]